MQESNFGGMMQAKHAGAVGGGSGWVAPPGPQDGEWSFPPAEGHDLRLDHEPFRLDIRPDRDRVHITPIGELDLASAGAVGDQLNELLDAGFNQLVIDLHRLSFIDSAGVRVVMAARARARHTRRSLDVVGAHGQVKRVLALTGVDHHFGLSAGNRPRMRAAATTGVPVPAALPPARPAERYRQPPEPATPWECGDD